MAFFDFHIFIGVLFPFLMKGILFFWTNQSLNLRFMEIVNILIDFGNHIRQSHVLTPLLIDEFLVEGEKIWNDILVLVGR